MTTLRKVIPLNQVIGYILAATFMLFPLLAYRDSPGLFGSPGLFHLALLTALGGAASAAAFANRGERLLSLFPGVTAGVCAALIWHAVLHTQIAASVPSTKLQLAITLGLGALLGFVVFWLLRKLRVARGGVAQQNTQPGRAKQRRAD